jgi:hypothetical protein
VRGDRAREVLGGGARLTPDMLARLPFDSRLPKVQGWIHEYQKAWRAAARPPALSAPRTRSGAAGGMLALARLFGMTVGATAVALVFHLVPTRAEPVSLELATALAVAAGVLSVLRLSRTARGL